MSDSNLHLFHCTKCDAVFEAKIPLSREVICPECRKPPGGLELFDSIEQIQQIKVHDTTHGVAGKDAADFVSIQMVTRKRRVIWAVVLWVIALTTLVGLVFYNREVRNYEAKEPSEFIKKQRKYQMVLQLETNRAMEIIDKYIDSMGAPEKSEYVIGGARQILKIENNLNSINFIQPKKPLDIVKNKIYLDTKKPRLDMLLRDANQRIFEMVLIKSDAGNWELDWQQHARFSGSEWTEFLVNQSVGNPKQFRLYLRRRHIVDGRDKEMINIIFHLPSMESGKRLQPSAEVKISVNDGLYKKFSDIFDSLSMQENTKNIDPIGSNDPDGFARVRVTLDWVDGPDGKPELIVKSLDALNWLGFDS